MVVCAAWLAVDVSTPEVCPEVKGLKRVFLPETPGKPDLLTPGNLPHQWQEWAAFSSVSWMAQLEAS